MLGEKITVLSGAQGCLYSFKKYKWNIPLSCISWNKDVWFVGLGGGFFFAWKPNKWTFLCVLANCFQKASLYCAVGNKVCLSHDKSSISMPAPDKWGMSANTPSLSKYKKTVWCPYHNTFSIIECFYAVRNVYFNAWVKYSFLCVWQGGFDCPDSFHLLIGATFRKWWRWSCADIVNLFLHVLADAECVSLTSHSHWRLGYASLEDRK